MQIDTDRCNELHEVIIKHIESHPELTKGEFLTVAMHAICNTIFSIECPRERQLTAKIVKRNLPLYLRQTMIDAAQQHGEAPMTGSHLH